MKGFSRLRKKERKKEKIFTRYYRRVLRPPALPMFANASRL